MRRRWQVHRFEVTGDAVYVASGWLWQRWRVVALVTAGLVVLAATTGLAIAERLTPGLLAPVRHR